MEAQLNALKEQVVVSSSHTRLGDVAKRMFDVVAASLGLVILSPLFVLVSILIKRDSAGPVFYLGPRIGRNGQPFRILKFRTMYEDAASYDGPRLTSSEDRRVTPLGNWLRNTKINELPQLWNVLLGDMSLVGPRPEDSEIIEVYPNNVRDEILSVRPGITGPASVLYHSEQDLLTNTDLMGTYLKEILPDKLRLDQLYVRNRSFASDLDIIFWTLAIFIPRIAKTSIPEGYLFAGPFSRFIHRHFSWFIVDLIVAFTAVCIATLAWRTQGPLEWGWNYLAVLSLSLALIFSTVNYLAGLNRIFWSRATGEDAIGLVFSSGFVSLLALVLNYLQHLHHWAPFPALPMVMVLAIGVLAPIGFLSVRYRLRVLAWLAESWPGLRRNERGVGERVLILGDGETSQIASWLLKRSMFRHAFSIVGIVSNEDPTKQGMRLNGCRVLGGIRDLPALVKQHDVRMIIYALSSVPEHIRDMIFDLSRTSSVKLVFLDDLIGFVSPMADKPAEAREYLDWLQRRTDYSPMRDDLTGLPNSVLLQERIRHSLAYAKRYNTSPAMVLIDLNGFAALSTADRGERADDELVKTVAKRLMTFKRESDTLARCEAHMFALLMENVPNRDAAETILRRIKAVVAEPIVIRNNKLPILADIGLYFPVGNLEDVQKRLHMRHVKPGVSDEAPVTRESQQLLLPVSGF